MNKGDIVEVTATGRVEEVAGEQVLVTVHGVEVPMMASQVRSPYEMRDMLIEALCTDGAHHKQWYLCQIAARIGIDVGSITHDKGIAP